MLDDIIVLAASTGMRYESPYREITQKASLAIATLCPPRKVRSPKSKATKARRANARELNGMVREILLVRDKASCRKCGRSSGKLDVSHVFAKGSHRWLRWDLDNVKLLCASPCHMTWWHGHPEEGMKWWEKEIGPQKMQALRLRAGHPQKRDADSWRLYLLGEAKKLGVTLP